MKTVLILLLALVSSGCGLFAKKKTPDQQRAEIRQEHANTLKMVYEKKPELEKRVAKAPGYATFSALNMNLLLLATARGTGVVIDNKTGKETFMSVIGIGGGLGAGVRDLRALFIFNERDALDEFVTSGWQFGAQADASLKSDGKGGELGESVSVSDGADVGTSGGVAKVTPGTLPIEVYKITKAGISLQATISGAKFSKDNELNP